MANIVKRSAEEASKSSNGSSRPISLLFRLVSALFFIILGYDFSTSAFFSNYPLFGQEIATTVLLSVLAAFFGFFTVPFLARSAKTALYNFVFRAVSDIVASFWDQNSKRRSEARRQKTNKKQQALLEDIEGGIVLDTSVLVDGRILGIAEIGFLPNKIIVPKGVLAELHLISDSKDKLKRQRGRRGLDVVNGLKKNKDINVIFPNVKTSTNFVDNMLIIFAKKHNLTLMTLDFNLNKLAKTQGVTVLNINELVEAVKLDLLPGEQLGIQIAQEGKEKKQGIGFLDDGTMVIVDKAKDKVGQTVKVKVKKVIQGPAGKIVFASE